MPSSPILMENGNGKRTLSRLALLAGGGLAAALALGRTRERAELSRAKHPSLAGHVRWAKRLAERLPAYRFDEHAFFRADGPTEEVARRREAGFAALAGRFAKRYPEGRALAAEAHEHLSDVRFVEAYRVPFPFAPHVARHLSPATMFGASDAVTLTDVDGNHVYDLGGSYGVNIFGYDVYRRCIDEGAALVRELGPVLGVYHPVVVSNAERLKRISGMDEVSFHMSGTEAVMQAVRLARFHTRRRRIVRFAGAYHGWWGDVQPGIGNPIPARDTLTLAEMSERTLRVLERRTDVACVLVNPLQALHPNGSAPGDSNLVDGARRAGFDRAAYTAWLHRLRDVCTRRGIVLILDEVFLGFRLAPGGAQEFFGVRADLVTYGKTVAGGLPVGVLCGRRRLMRRYRDDRPGDLNFARGTFHSHPYVMGAMHAFLDVLERPETRALYAGLHERWDARAAALNARLEAAGYPVRVANLSTVWTTLYTRPGRYHWMFQFYLRDAGLALPWIGTARFIFSLAYTEEQFAAVADRFLAAAERMHADGWWWDGHGLSHRDIRRRILVEMLRSQRRAQPAGSARSDP
jgi:glutamate-1-semialdehyde 2,1-aminomutase